LKAGQGLFRQFLKSFQQITACGAKQLITYQFNKKLKRHDLKNYEYVPDSLPNQGQWRASNFHKVPALINFRYCGRNQLLFIRYPFFPVTVPLQLLVNAI
jgi:hypothetical protein